MKKTFLIIVIAACTVALTMPPVNKFESKAEEQNNILIFAYSKPVNQYNVLGVVKIKGIVISEKAPDVLEKLIKKAKSEFPSGEGIIINSEFDKAEVIKFNQ